MNVRWRANNEQNYCAQRWEILRMAQDKNIMRLSIQESSRLPIILWDDTKCQTEVNDLVQLLLTPKMLDLFAIHEAGHEIYFRRAGVTTFTFDSPRIIYFEKNENPFTQQRARIRPSNYVKPEGDDWLLKLAKGYAAGGRCSIRLTTTDYAGDTNDRSMFDEMYIDCYRGFTTNKKDIARMWLDAQDSVNKDLNEERFQSQVRAKAQEIMPQLFPWLNTQYHLQ